MVSDIVPFEMHTKARIEPPTTAKDLSACLLDESDMKATMHYRAYLTWEGHTLISTYQPSLYEKFLNIIKPEMLLNGTIKRKEAEEFRWSIANRKIVQKYGLTNITYIGSRNRVTGILVSSKVTNDGQQKQRFLEIIRAIKKGMPKMRIQWENCSQTTTCSLEDIKAFKEFSDGK